MYDAAGLMPVDRSAAEGGGGELLDVEQLGKLHVRVAVDAAGFDACHVDGDVERGVVEPRGDDESAGDVGEPAANLGDHELAADERHFGVTGVDLPDAGRGHDVSVDGPSRGDFVGGDATHGGSPRSGLVVNVRRLRWRTRSGSRP